MNDTMELLSHIKLRFNIDHPTFEECYLFGYDCALAELEESENPFRQGTQEYDQWQEGWWAGFFGEKPVFAPTKEDEYQPEKEDEAANDKAYPFISNLVHSHVFLNLLKITGAIAATAVVGYQVIELVA
jgi:hypothetical protein